MLDTGNKIKDWLKDYLESSNLNHFVIGVSGGIDSAVTSTLCAMTGKPTILVSMPIHQNEKELKRANSHMWWLGQLDNVINLEFDLTQTYETFKLMWLNEDDNLALANTRSRLRMTTLYHVATMNKGLVVGTGNKVEDFGIGFYTKYGDGGVDISPIADLMKSEVRELAKSLNIIQEIIDAPPTDGLWDDGRTDENQIGATYDELEWAMNEIDNPSDEKELNERLAEVMKIYLKLNSMNSHKMNPIPIFKYNKE